MKKRLSLKKLTNRLAGEKQSKSPRAIASPVREWQWLLGVSLFVLLVGLGGIYKTYISFNTEYGLEVDSHERIIYPSEMVTEAVTKYEERKKLFSQNLPEQTESDAELEGEVISEDKDNENSDSEKDVETDSISNLELDKDVEELTPPTLSN